MKRFLSLITVLMAIMGLSTISTSAQSGNHLVGINVNLSCGHIAVSIDSEYDTAINVYIYVATQADNIWNLVNDVADFTPVGIRGSVHTGRSFQNQDPNTQLSYSVRVYDNDTSLLVAQRNGREDCDGQQNNAPVNPTPTSPNTITTSSGTVTFLASCDNAGGITVQPIGGVAFNISGTQITQGTAMAVANGQNVAITTVGTISAIGTPTNSVQLVSVDGYSLLIPATSCAQTVTVYTPNTSSSDQASALSCSNTPADAVSTHVVSAGENLFRIGLRYGVHFTTLATYNGISDATRIFVGQCIAIPPSV